MWVCFQLYLLSDLLPVGLALIPLLCSLVVYCVNCVLFSCLFSPSTSVYKQSCQSLCSVLYIQSYAFSVFLVSCSLCILESLSFCLCVLTWIQRVWTLCLCQIISNKSMYLFLLYHQKQRVTDELYYMAEKTIFCVPLQ